MKTLALLSVLVGLIASALLAFQRYVWDAALLFLLSLTGLTVSRHPQFLGAGDFGPGA